VAKDQRRWASCCQSRDGCRCGCLGSLLAPRSACWSAAWRWVFVIDSKQYRGRLRLDPTGRVRHGRYPLAPTLEAVSFEADRAAVVLIDPDVADQARVRFHIAA
jgi:hypothetical protein